MKVDPDSRKLMMEFQNTVSDEVHLRAVAKDNPNIKAMLHNISIIKNNTPFTKLDQEAYNRERIYCDADVCTSKRFKEYRMPRI